MVDIEIMDYKSYKSYKDDLISLMIENSLIIGEEDEFILASGRKTNMYFDCCKTTCLAKGMRLIGNLIHHRIDGFEIDAVGGITMGADPITFATVAMSINHGQFLKAFSVRKERKDYGIKDLIKGAVKKGDHVLIVEDVITTGASTIKAIVAAREFGLVVVKVIALLDRQEDNGIEKVRKYCRDVEALVRKEELLRSI